MRKFIFIGERPSNKALEMGVSWEDGRLAAKQLFDALQMNGLDPKNYVYTNWFRPTQGPLLVKRNIKQVVSQAVRVGYEPVALGKNVCKAMTVAGIQHLTLVHPAARGRIRKKERYAKHIREVLIYG